MALRKASRPWMGRYSLFSSFSIISRSACKHGLNPDRQDTTVHGARSACTRKTPGALNSDATRRRRIVHCVSFSRPFCPCGHW